MLTPSEKSPLLEKFSSEDWTHNAASSRTVSPILYQWAIPAPCFHHLTLWNLNKKMKNTLSIQELFFFLNPLCVHISYLISHVHLAIHLVWKKLIAGHHAEAFEQNVVLPNGQYSLLTFHTTSSDIDTAWGPQVQHKARSGGFIFFHTFKLNGMTLYKVEKQFQVENPETTFNQGNGCCFTDCVKKLSTSACIQIFINWIGSNLVWW